MENKNIFDLLQNVRVELAEANLTKSGKNKFQNFDYFELKDFVPTATKLFAKYNLTPIFNIEVGQDGVEYAVLDIIKGDSANEKIRFKTPTAEPSGNNPIQQLGAKITYLRRYLYLIALDIVENDQVDGVDQNETKKNAVKYATPFQVEKIFQNGKLIKDLLEANNIKSKNDVKGLTLEKASEICAELEKRLQNETH